MQHKMTQEGGPNEANVTVNGTIVRPNVTNEEAMASDYIQQSLIPLSSETHSGAGEYLVQS